jgi:hypothetical protein
MPPAYLSVVTSWYTKRERAVAYNTLWVSLWIPADLDRFVDQANVYFLLGAANSDVSHNRAEASKADFLLLQPKISLVTTKSKMGES